MSSHPLLRPASKENTYASTVRFSQIKCLQSPIGFASSRFRITHVNELRIGGKYVTR